MENIMFDKKVMIVALGLFVSYCHAMESENGQPFLDDSVLNAYYEYVMQKNAGYPDIEHKPLMIMLSGCCGMGKTMVAKKLKEEVSIIRFNGDDSREFLKPLHAFHVSMPVATKVGKILTSFSHLVEHVKDEVPNK